MSQATVLMYHLMMTTYPVITRRLEAIGLRLNWRKENQNYP